MSKELISFTVRMSPELARQIEARAEVNKRSRCSEIVYILEMAIDRVVASDLSLMKS